MTIINDFDGFVDAHKKECGVVLEVTQSRDKLQCSNLSYNTFRFEINIHNPHLFNLFFFKMAELCFMKLTVSLLHLKIVCCFRER